MSRLLDDLRSGAPARKRFARGRDRAHGADSLKIRLDRDVCSGHGRCYVLAPDVFDEDERGHCVLDLEEVPEEFRKQAQAGVDGCPEHALSIER
jgi:ferredoxin